MSDEMVFNGDMCKKWEEDVRDTNQRANKVLKELNTALEEMQRQATGALGDAFCTAVGDTVNKFVGLVDAVTNLADVVKQIRGLWFDAVGEVVVGIGEAVKRLN